MPDVETIEKELLTLIQDEGLSPQRMALYGRSIMEAVNTTSPQVAVDKVVAAVDKVEGNYHTALVYAFAFDSSEDDVTNLSQRRAMLIERDDFPDISEATLRRWEKKGITLVARALHQPFGDLSDDRSEEDEGMDAETMAKVQLARLLRIRQSLDEQTSLLREIRDLLKSDGRSSLPPPTDEG